MDKASFLQNDRFREPRHKLADDYIASIAWLDSHQVDNISLGLLEYDTTIEDAQYLPQKYIEEVCNNLDDSFQNEINKVIFSYIDEAERGHSKNLKDLISSKSESIEQSIQLIQNEIAQVNNRIIHLEDKKTVAYKKQISDNLEKKKEILERHDKSKPIEVKKPSDTPNQEYQDKLESLNKAIGEKSDDIVKVRNQLKEVNIKIDDADLLYAKIDRLLSNATELGNEILEFCVKHKVDNFTPIAVQTPRLSIQELRNAARKQKELLLSQINEETGSLIIALKEDLEKKRLLIDTANSNEKAFQKYLEDLKFWDDEKNKINGNEQEPAEDTLNYFKQELDFLNKNLDDEYDKLKLTRTQKIKDLFSEKLNLVRLYEALYNPIKSEIQKILGEMEERIEFNVDIELENNNLADELLRYINKRYSGIFGDRDGQAKMNSFIKQTDFNDENSLIFFLENVMQAIYEDFENSAKKIKDKEGFYSFLFNLDYLRIVFELKMGNKNLRELSPGQRGIMLLIFYLALSKNDSPIIIDQPEDNLDNQSVYAKLVPCICEAKKRRQVIIVTHNPNIAIACDAEQIIYCEKDKINGTLVYTSGAIEDEDMRRHVVDILEGTMPAFDLRSKKYSKRS